MISVRENMHQRRGKSLTRSKGKIAPKAQKHSSPNPLTSWKNSGTPFEPVKKTGLPLRLPKKNSGPPTNRHSPPRKKW